MPSSPGRQMIGGKRCNAAPLARLANHCLILLARDDRNPFSRSGVQSPKKRRRTEGRHGGAGVPSMTSNPCLPPKPKASLVVLARGLGSGHGQGHAMPGPLPQRDRQETDVQVPTLPGSRSQGGGGRRQTRADKSLIGKSASRSICGVPLSSFWREHPGCGKRCAPFSRSRTSPSFSSLCMSCCSCLFLFRTWGYVLTSKGAGEFPPLIQRNVWHK